MASNNDSGLNNSILSMDSSSDAVEADKSSADGDRGQLPKAPASAARDSSSSSSGTGRAAAVAAAGDPSCGDGGSGTVGEQFLVLAKTAKGAAAVQLVKEALEAPGLYVFAEILHMPNIKELSSLPEYSPYYRLMEVFAFGVYEDYLKNEPPLPPLSPLMLTKLRHLTIVTMANSTKTLHLDNLLKELCLNSRRELEDLIIEAIYADVLHGKLDQKNGVLEVDFALGRDIKPEDLPQIAATLKAWCNTCNGLLGTLESLVWKANSTKEENLRRASSIENEVSKIKSNLKRQAGGGSADVDDGMPQSDSIRDFEKKFHRLKKGAGSSGITKPTPSKFWPKS
ncbi:Proteasome component (PCI) domain [Trinorchestia longiramus]|nr:Proteasome component (PCI) domain [Trinorchestia longiramus]